MRWVDFMPEDLIEHLVWGERSNVLYNAVLLGTDLVFVIFKIVQVTPNKDFIAKNLITTSCNTYIL